MCGERVRRCRAACRAQGGAGYLLDPEGPAAGARARTAGFPRLPRFLRFRAEPTGSDRTGR